MKKNWDTGEPEVVIKTFALEGASDFAIMRQTTIIYRHIFGTRSPVLRKMRDNSGEGDVWGVSSKDNVFYYAL